MKTQFDRVPSELLEADYEKIYSRIYLHDCAGENDYQLLEEIGQELASRGLPVLSPV